MVELERVVDGKMVLLGLRHLLVGWIVGLKAMRVERR